MINSLELSVNGASTVSVRNNKNGSINLEVTPQKSEAQSEQPRLLTPQRLKESPTQPKVLFGSNEDSNKNGEDGGGGGGDNTLLVAEQDQALELNVGSDNSSDDNNSLSSEGTTTATDAPLLQQTNNSPPLSPLTNNTGDNTTITEEQIKEDTSSYTEEEKTTLTEEETTTPVETETTLPKDETTTPSETETTTPSETETTLPAEGKTTTPSEEDAKKSKQSASIISYIGCCMLNAAMTVIGFFWAIVSAGRWLWSKLISIGKAYAPWLVSAKDLLVAVASFRFLSDTKDLPAVEASSFNPLAPVEWLEERVRGESGGVQFLLSFFVYVIVLFAGVPVVVFVFLVKLVADIVYSSFFLFVGVLFAGLSSKDFFPFKEKVGKILLSVGKLLMLVTSVIGFIYTVFKTLGLIGLLIGLPGGYLLGILVLEHIIVHRGSKEFQWIPDRATSATNLACLLSDAKVAGAAWLLFECLRNGWCRAKTGLRRAKTDIRGIRDATIAYIGGNRQREDLDEKMPSFVNKLGKKCLTIGKLLMFVTLGIGLIYTVITTLISLSDANPLSKTLESNVTTASPVEQFACFIDYPVIVFSDSLDAGQDNKCEGKYKQCPPWGQCKDGKLLNCNDGEDTFDGMVRFVVNDLGDDCVISPEAKELTRLVQATLVDMTTKHVCRSSSSSIDDEFPLFSLHSVAARVRLSVSSTEDLEEYVDLKPDILIWLRPVFDSKLVRFGALSGDDKDDVDALGLGGGVLPNSLPLPFGCKANLVAIELLHLQHCLGRFAINKLWHLLWAYPLYTVGSMVFLRLVIWFRPSTLVTFLSVTLIERLNKPKEVEDAEAIYKLGYSYHHGKHGYPQNWAKALEFYHRAAELGHPRAMGNLGNAYYYGRGVEVDKHKALEFYHRVAELGNADAYFNIGCAYFNGDGAKVDKKKAVHYWKLAAELGSADAYFSLGNSYNNGTGVEVDYKKAMHYLQQAAELGISGAMFNLGHSYNKGRGVKVDKKRAIHYWQLAAASGNAKAKRKLDVLGKH